MPQKKKKSLCHDDTADKKSMPKQTKRNTIKAFLAQHKIQGIGKKDLSSNGKQQGIGQEN